MMLKQLPSNGTWIIWIVTSVYRLVRFLSNLGFDLHLLFTFRIGFFGRQIADQLLLERQLYWRLVGA